MISTLPIFSERWLYPRIPSFRKAFDRAELRVEAHNGEHDGEREDVDAWILYSNGRHPGYSVTRLFGEEVFPVCSPEFRKALSPHPGPEEVITQPLLHDIYWDTDWPEWARAVGVTTGEFAADMRFALYKGVIASPTSADPPPSSRRLRFPVTGRPASGSLASDSGQSGRTSPPPAIDRDLQ